MIDVSQISIPGLLLSALGVMATVVAVLWKLFSHSVVKAEEVCNERLTYANTRITKLEAESRECQEDRVELWKQMAELARNLNK